MSDKRNEALERLAEAVGATEPLEFQSNKEAYPSAFADVRPE